MIFLGLRVCICSVEIEHFVFTSSSAKRFTLHDIRTLSLYWFSLDAHVVQVWCSTGAMAQYADVYAVDMKTM